MPKTRRNSQKNRRSGSRKNRKNMRGAGFFDFFKPKAAAPVTAPVVTNNKTAINTSLPVSPAPGPTPRRSFMNRVRGTRNKAVGSLRTFRNNTRNLGRGLGEHFRTVRNTMRTTMKNTMSGKV